MMPWMKDFQQVSQVTGWEPIRLHLNSYVDWYWDCAAWTYLNLWFVPFRMPELYSDTDRWVSQFSLNGIKSSSICK
jgi:hypothetical protein